jgi:hypothetical protein
VLDKFIKGLAERLLVVMIIVGVFTVIAIVATLLDNG